MTFKSKVIFFLIPQKTKGVSPPFFVGILLIRIIQIITINCPTFKLYSDFHLLIQLCRGTSIPGILLSFQLSQREGPGYEDHSSLLRSWTSADSTVEYHWSLIGNTDPGSFTIPLDFLRYPHFMEYFLLRYDFHIGIILLRNGIEGHMGYDYFIGFKRYFSSINAMELFMGIINKARMLVWLLEHFSTTPLPGNLSLIYPRTISTPCGLWDGRLHPGKNSFGKSWDFIWNSSFKDLWITGFLEYGYCFIFFK